jgi:hypothetical protein
MKQGRIANKGHGPVDSILVQQPALTATSKAREGTAREPKTRQRVEKHVMSREWCRGFPSRRLVDLLAFSTHPP